MAELREVESAAREVLKILGPGYNEAVYEEALAHEFRLRGIVYERQRNFEILYKGYKVGDGRADFVVNPLWAGRGGKELVVELKAVRTINEGHKRQAQVYLVSLNVAQGAVISFADEVLIEQVTRPARDLSRKVVKPKRGRVKPSVRLLSGAAREVFRYFGQEFIYREDAKKLFPDALAVELRLRGLGFTVKEYPVLYKGHKVSTLGFDFTFTDGSVADVMFYKKPEQIDDAVEELRSSLALFGLGRGYAVLLPEGDTGKVIVKTI
ncbi:MAG: GxxExxY protein [candidate division WOR-3 bacterium]